MASKPVRYTEARKRQVLRAVNRHNAVHGRGGLSRAAARFAVAQPTIRRWWNLANPDQRYPGRRPSDRIPLSPNKSRGEARDRIRRKIANIESQIGILRRQYERVQAMRDEFY